jgi:hypothetical protein
VRQFLTFLELFGGLSPENIHPFHPARRRKRR